MKKVVLVTGSSGLIGSESALFFDNRGWQVHGIDNNMRREFFGPDGDTLWNLERVRGLTKDFQHHDLDIRDRQAMFILVKTLRPDLVIHCAAQPSHDLAATRPFDDFDVNAVGTINLLEAVRQYSGESPFIFMSTNKVYGDAPNEFPLIELETRFDYESQSQFNGVDESCRIDATTHSLFGASKVAADVIVQEYGRYFDLPTVCFRGGCLTGSAHSGAELHGFLAYLARAVAEGRTYRIFGYKGKQVRDNIHAFDVATAFLSFYENPRRAAIYNLGGGRENSVSVIEAIQLFEDALATKLSTEYVHENRIGDHICYISDLTNLRNDYPQWEITKSLEMIIEELAVAASVKS